MHFRLDQWPQHVYLFTELAVCVIVVLFFFLIRLYCGSLVHGAAQELRRGIEPESFLAGAPVAIRLYRNLQAAVEGQVDEDFITRMRTRAWPMERQTPVDGLSKAFEHLLEEDEQEGEDQSMKDDKLMEEACSARTRHKTKRRTPKSRFKKQERVSWQ